MAVEAVGQVVGDAAGQMVGEAAGHSAYRTGMAFSAREWVRLAIAGGLSLAASYAIGRLFGVPVMPDENGSLLAGPGPVVAMFAGLAIVLAGLVIGRVVAGTLGAEAAVLCGGLGLWLLGVRCGPIRPVLWSEHGRATLLAMAVEVVVLGAALIGGWLAILRWAPTRAGSADGEPPVMIAGELDDAPPGKRATATLAAAAVAAAIELLLIQTDGSKQCMAGVGVAAFLGTIAGYMYVPLAEGAWYWAAPVVVGVAGDLAAVATGDGTSPTGELHGLLAALARPTPLHRAGLGIAAAVFAHWCCRRWALDAQDEPELAEADAVVP